MKNAIAVLGGLGVGALLMYLFDPNGGNRRRALIKDKAFSFSNSAQKAVRGKAEDLRNRAGGMLHEAKSAFSGGETEDRQAFENGRTF